MTAEARRELDLERDGVLRAVLVAHGPGHHTLLLVVHHLAVDGESTGILLADLLAAYVHGEVPGPAPEAGFDAYAADRAAEAAAATGTAEAYWRERLDGADLTVDFPLDVPGGDGGDGAPREAAVPLELDTGAWDRIRAFSRAHRAGAAAVLLAAYLKALTTYGRQDAPTVGVPLGARTDPRFDRTVGYFVRTLLVRAPQPAPELTAAGYVTAVQRELARAVDHSGLPFPRIAALAPDGAGPSVFNCTFVLHSWAEAGAAATDGVALRDGLRAHWRQDVHTPGLGLLTLELYEGEGRLHGRLKYDATRLEPATAEAFTEHVATLAAQLVAEPERPVGALDGIGPRARATLDFLNATDHPVPDTDIDTLLRERAADRGDATAVEADGLRWSYRELDARIDAFAAGLEQAGVRPGDRVGVLLPRSADAVAAMLAVLRTGAAYVPLDAAHPEARRRHIADSSGMRLALVDPATADACPPGPRRVLLSGLAVPGGRAALPRTVRRRRPARAVHLRFHRPAQGRPAQPPRPGHRRPGRDPALRPGARGRRAAQGALHLRRQRPRDARRPGVRRPPGRRPAGRRARPRPARRDPGPARGDPAARRAVPAAAAAGGRHVRRQPHPAHRGVHRGVAAQRAARRLRGRAPGTAAQRLRTDRDVVLDGVLLEPRRPGLLDPAGRGADRRALRQHPLLRPRRRAAPAAPGRPRRAVDRRRHGLRRLRRGPGAHRGALPHAPARRPHGHRLPHRRPGAAAARRHAHPPGPPRRPGEGQRQPRGTRRGQGRPRGAARRA
ncbi:hypothetical protein RKD35_000097 [Streptomyces albogriseolus]